MPGLLLPEYLWGWDDKISDGDTDGEEGDGEEGDGEEGDGEEGDGEEGDLNGGSNEESGEVTAVSEAGGAPPQRGPSLRPEGGRSIPSLPRHSLQPTYNQITFERGTSADDQPPASPSSLVSDDYVRTPQEYWTTQLAFLHDTATRMIELTGVLLTSQRDAALEDRRFMHSREFLEQIRTDLLSRITRNDGLASRDTQDPGAAQPLQAPSNEPGGSSSFEDQQVRLYREVTAVLQDEVLQDTQGNPEAEWALAECSRIGHALLNAIRTLVSGENTASPDV